MLKDPLVVVVQGNWGTLNHYFSPLFTFYWSDSRNIDLKLYLQSCCKVRVVLPAYENRKKSSERYKVRQQENEKRLQQRWKFLILKKKERTLHATNSYTFHLFGIFTWCYMKISLFNVPVLKETLACSFHDSAWIIKKKSLITHFHSSLKNKLWSSWMSLKILNKIIFKIFNSQITLFPQGWHGFICWIWTFVGY